MIRIIEQYLICYTYVMKDKIMLNKNKNSKKLRFAIARS